MEPVRVLLLGAHSPKLVAVEEAARRNGHPVVWADAASAAHARSIEIVISDSEAALSVPALGGRRAVTVIISERPPGGAEIDEWIAWPANPRVIRARLRSIARWAEDRRELDRLRPAPAASASAPVLLDAPHPSS